MINVDFFNDIKDNESQLALGFEPPKDTDTLLIELDKYEKYANILRDFEEKTNNSLTEKLLSRNFNTPFKNIQFVFEHTFGSQGGKYSHFKITMLEDNKVYVTYENPNLKKDAIFSITYWYSAEQVTESLQSYIYGGTEGESSIVKFVYISYLLMLYIAETKSYELQESVQIKSKVQGGKKGKKKKVTQTKIVLKRYVPKLPTGTKYDRHAEAWKVRGHYRVYKKSGKKVWVEPHVKGKNRDKSDSVPNKNYRL